MVTGVSLIPVRPATDAEVRTQGSNKGCLDNFIAGPENILVAVVYLVIGAVIVSSAPGGQVTLQIALAKPKAFGEYLFQRHWLAIEIVSLLLLIALVAALYLGRKKPEENT